MSPNAGSALAAEHRPAALRVAWGCVAVAALAFVLIVLGAVVRARGAGLACPDWPLCYGSFVPAFDAGIALEWGHRLLAGSASLGLVAVSLAAWRRPAVRSRVGGALRVAWGLLALQVLLGGLTVLLGLAPWTVTAHLLVGNAFCASLVWSAHDLLDAGREHRVPAVCSPAVAALVGACALLLIVQLALGGLVSSHYAGLACAHFPSCDGESFAPRWTGLVGLHLLHRVTALALLAAWGALAWTSRRTGWVGRLAGSGFRLLVVQAAIGIANVLLHLPVEVTALHSATAAGLVIVAALLGRAVLRARAEAGSGWVPGAEGPGSRRDWAEVA